MGLRARLLNRIKRTLGQDASPIVPRPPRPPPGVRPLEPLKAQQEPGAQPRAGNAEPAPEPASVTAPALAPQPQPQPAAEAVPALEPRTDGLVPGAIPVAVRNMDDEDEGWDSDYATNDAPVRNAHYRGVFESTGDALQVRVLDEEASLDVVFSCEPGEFILDAADRAGFELPFSCRSGGCLSCSALLLSGRVDMGEQYVLEDEHTSAGYFLLCCSTAQTDLVVRSHQEDHIT